MNSFTAPPTSDPEAMPKKAGRRWAIGSAVVIAVVAAALAFAVPLDSPRTVSPIKIDPPDGCTVMADIGLWPGDISTGRGLWPGEKAPAYLTGPDYRLLQCDGDEPVKIKGDFRDRAYNHYDFKDTGIKAALVVSGEARVFHVGSMLVGGEDVKAGCLTIQRLDEVSPSRDECDVDRLDGWTDQP